MKDLGRKLWLVGIAVCVVAAVVYYGRSQESHKITTSVERRDLAVTVNLTGQTQAAKSYTLSSSLDGDKGKITFLVPDGARVKKDEVLVSFDRSPFEEKLLIAEAEYAMLESELEVVNSSLSIVEAEIIKEIAVAQYTIESAKSALIRIKLGDGPLKLSEMEQELIEARDAADRHKAFVIELEKLVNEGVTDGSELKTEQKAAQKKQALATIANRRLVSYRDYVHPEEISDANTTLAKAENELSDLKKYSVYRIRQANAKQKKARRSLAAKAQKIAHLKVQLVRSQVLAPFDGYVVHAESLMSGTIRTPRLGDKVFKGKPIMYLPSIGDYLVEAQVRETDLHKVAAGQDVTIVLDAYPSIPMIGKVDSIGALASKRNPVESQRYFDIRVRIDDADHRIRPGMTARIVLQGERKNQVIAVPSYALFKVDDQYYVLKPSGESIPIATGMHTGQWTEVLSGVQPGDIISAVKL